MRRLVPVLALAALTACVPQAWRGFAPKIHFKTKVAAPTFKQVSLPNGLTLLVHEDPHAPVTSVWLALRAGADTDPAGKAGLASLAEELATRGAGSRDADALAQAFDQVGSPVATRVAADQSLYSLTVMPFDAAPALGLLADVVRRPRFDAGQFQQLRTEAIADAGIPQSDPQQLGARTLIKTLFGAHSVYGRQTTGTPESLKAITLDDVKAWHRKWVGPNTTAVILTGRVSFGQAIAWTRAAFGTWKAKAAEPPAPKAPAAAKRTRIQVIARPGLTQTTMIMGRPGVDARSPDRFPLDLATTILRSRLTVQLREKDHISYGSGTQSVAFRSGGVILAVTKVQADHTGKALQESLGELEHLHSGILHDTTVVPLRVGVIEQRLAGIGTTDGQAAAAATIFFEHRPLNAPVTDLRRLEHLDAGQVQQAASRYFGPDTWQIVLVGDPQIIEKQVGKLGLGKLVTVVPPKAQAPAPKPQAPPPAPKAATADAGH